MKSLMKRFLINTGLWYSLDLFRRIPKICSWLRAGCVGVAPHPVKMMIVASYLEKYGINQFVETGTYMGDTLGYIARKGIKCFSIELSEELFELAGKRFSGFDNVHLVKGDSTKELPKLLADINEPCLFWLDGHYSAGNTALGETETPVSGEVEAILAHKIKKHVILIDDARCFNGTGDYPHLDTVLKAVRENGAYSAEVSADIIRLVPR